MKLSLAGAPSRWLWLGGLVLVAGTLVWQASLYWLAEHWAESSEPKDWLRAAELQPGNASYWYRLGRFREADFTQADLDQAIRYYRRAVALNPRSATYWSQLAGAYALGGQPERAGEAFHQARVSHPVSAQVAWSYGNFLLQQGELSAALAQWRRALVVDPRRTRFAVALAWRASQDVDHVLNELLPSESGSYFEALHYFLSQQELRAALSAWNRLLALKEPFELRRTLPLVETLMRQERLGEAQEVWQQAVHAGGWDEKEPAVGSLVWNGGFEHELVSGGFGWRQLRVVGASFGFDHTIRRSKTRSARITFDGSANLDFQHLLQYVLVEPQSRYRFTAFLRSEGISTDSGIRLRLFDPKRPATLDLLTPELHGSQPWSRLQADFTTGLETRLVVIAVRRFPSRKLDNKLRGTVWMDDVSLIRLTVPSSRRTP